MAWDYVLCKSVYAHQHPAAIESTSAAAMLQHSWLLLQVYDYHGKLLCTPKVEGIPLDTLAPPMVALSSDILALLHPATRTSVHFFHVAGGHATAEALRIRRDDDSRRLVSDGNVAVMDIVSIALSQTGSQVRPAACTGWHALLQRTHFGSTYQGAQLKAVGGQVYMYRTCSFT